MANEPVVHVIDDDDSARQSLEFLIDCAGLKVRSYASAVAFLKAVPDMEHGCIVTDVRMPEMTGMELLGRLKALEVRDPVIVITGHADVPMAIQAMKEGVADFIEKPFSDDAILGAIRAALARHSDRAQANEERALVNERLASLSPREREVLDGLVEGHANKVIAFDLDISARTVEVYRANVMAKMHARSLSELVRMVTIARLPD
ncbi:response regulator FixJ [Sphingomonas sp.]|jgi:two-component system response regulator FixJ|uniref:response regulator FixJ n=1 Tax=Sphingomonas sp. TaxID=28214 RepID=UPI002DBCDDEE|nr:response regulator FixJ [Sphingomonas sp.]HEU4970030.1 response regulator FixJ [Sphingomonas sp.]